MSARKLVVILAVVLIAGLLAAGCPSKGSQTATTAAMTTPAKPAGAAATSADKPGGMIVTPGPGKGTEVAAPGKDVYICRKHPQQVSTEPGTCNVGGEPMEKVTQEEARKVQAEFKPPTTLPK